MGGLLCSRGCVCVHVWVSRRVCARVFVSAIEAVELAFVVCMRIICQFCLKRQNGIIETFNDEVAHANFTDFSGEEGIDEP